MLTLKRGRCFALLYGFLVGPLKRVSKCPTLYLYVNTTKGHCSTNNVKMKFKILPLLFLLLLLGSCSTNNENSTTLLNQPLNLTGQLMANNRIYLNWEKNSTDENQFKIERKTESGNFSVIATNAENSNTTNAWYNDIDLQPGSYTYRVQAYDTDGNTSEYSNEVTLTIAPPPIVTDIDGNVYYYKTICNQVWTTKNLSVTHYRNGDPIPQVTSNQQWGSLTTGAWCYYNNDPSTESTYGRLYNWYAVNDPRGLAPLGFHIPSSIEFNELKTCAGYNGNGGGKLKVEGTTHWASPNLGMNTGCMTCTTPANNSLGFTALPTQWRFDGGGSFDTWYIGEYAKFWSSSDCILMSLRNDDPNIWIGNGAKGYGYSVRCIKD